MAEPRQSVRWVAEYETLSQGAVISKGSIAFYATGSNRNKIANRALHIIQNKHPGFGARIWKLQPQPLS